MSQNLPSVIPQSIANLIIAQKATPTTNTGDFQYLKMTKMGEWVFGAEETEVHNESAFVIDPDTYAQGYVAWDEDGNLINEMMTPSGQTPILKANLPILPSGATWKNQVALGLFGVEGEQKGVQLLYKTSSGGGKEAVSKMVAEIVARGEAGNPAFCPVVFLDNTNYKHKKYGKIFKPFFTVDEWVAPPSNAAEPVAAEPVAAEPVAAEPVAAEPKTRTRRTRQTA
tara:strand:+ start:203 stop:880 length:678 start_codon:yes stop_codon:yes gene_type:complete